MVFVHIAHDQTAAFLAEGIEWNLLFPLFLACRYSPKAQIGNIFLQCEIHTTVAHERQVRSSSKSSAIALVSGTMVGTVDRLQ